MRKMAIAAFLMLVAAVLFSCDYIAETVDNAVDEWSDLDQYGGEKDEDIDFGVRDPDFPGMDCGDACYYAADQCPLTLYNGEVANCVQDCDAALDIDENRPSDFSYKTCILECIMDCGYYEDCIDKCMPELED